MLEYYIALLNFDWFSTQLLIDMPIITDLVFKYFSVKFSYQPGYQRSSSESDRLHQHGGKLMMHSKAMLFVMFSLKESLADSLNHCIFLCREGFQQVFVQTLEWTHSSRTWGLNCNKVSDRRIFDNHSQEDSPCCCSR